MGPAAHEDVERDIAQVQAPKQDARRADARERIVKRAAQLRPRDDEHGAQEVEQQRRRQNAEADEDTAVALIQVGEQQQQQRGEQVPLVHVMAEGEDDAQHARRRQVQRPLPPRARAQRGERGPLPRRQHEERAQQQEHAVEHAERDERRPPDGIRHAQHLRLHRSPVEPEQRGEVVRLDGRIGVGADGIRIAADQIEQLLIALERERAHKQHQQRREHRERRVQQFLLPRGRRGRIRKIRRRKQRPEHERLRLEQDGEAVHRARENPALRQEQAERAHHAEREQRIDLPPRAGDEHGRRVEGQQRAERQREHLAHALPLGEAVHQVRRGEIRDRGRELEEEHHARAAVGEAEHAAQPGDGPADVHIARRVVREHAGGVEIGHAVGRHGVAPGHEAVDIRRVADEDERERQAQHKRRRHDRAEHRARPGRVFERVRLAFEHARIEQRVQQQRKRGHGQHRGKHRPARRCGRRAALIGGGHQVDDRARGDLVARVQRHIAKPGRAAALHAVAAQAQRRAQRRLLRAGAHIQRQLRPAGRAGEPAAVAVGAVKAVVIDGKGRALPALHVLGAHHGAQAVHRIRRHGHILIGAHVVAGGALHADGRARLRRPAHGQVEHIGRFGKIRIIEQLLPGQVIVLRQRGRGQQAEYEQYRYELSHRATFFQEPPHRRLKFPSPNIA